MNRIFVVGGLIPPKKEVSFMTKEEQLVELLRTAESMAVRYADGHVTIMRFTTGWKVMLGTPEMTVEFSGDFEITGGGYGEVGRLPGYDSLEEAVATLIKKGPSPRRYSQITTLPPDC